MPILVNGKQDTLCYEIHGRASRFFNLISDACVSVSAAYVEVHANSTNEPLNVIGEVGVLAVDNAGECVRISIEAESCKAAVNSVPVDDVMYSSQGVRVRQGRNYVRVSAPNCADSTLTMWTLCRSLEGNAMIKFVVTRGLNLRETAHGLIGERVKLALCHTLLIKVDFHGDISVKFTYNEHITCKTKFRMLVLLNFCLTQQV